MLVGDELTVHNNLTFIHNQTCTLTFLSALIFWKVKDAGGEFKFVFYKSVSSLNDEQVSQRKLIELTAHNLGNVFWSYVIIY